MTRTVVSPLSTLISEYDVLIQIQTLRTAIPLTLDVFHIKGHQDRDTPLEQLSLPAQANCAADALAGGGCECCHDRSIAFLLPAAQCSLTIREQTITHHFAQTLRRHAFQSSLRRHILQSRPWSDTFCIDWSIFGNICTRHPHRLQFYLKLCHRLLPVGRVLHRRSSDNSPYCPACGELEDHDHWITCDHSSQAVVKRSLLNTLRKELASLTIDPILADAIIEGVNSALVTTSFPLSRYSAPYQLLLQHQQSLGWLNFLCGFISYEWTQLHQQYLRITQQDTVRLPCPFVRVITSVWSSLHALWKLWNSQRHSNDASQHLAEQARLVQCKLTRIYRLRTTVMPSDRFLFRASLEIHRQEPLSRIQAWLHNHYDYLEKSHLRACRENLTHTASLHHYFRPP